ncbi:hypothetical protein BH11MYX1_BH11MYX1_43660 [soil metagenome]
MRILAMSLVALAVAVAPAAADPKWSGAAVTLEFKQAPFADLVRVLADAGHLNVVLIVDDSLKLDINAKRQPWDQVLDDVIGRAKLSSVHIGPTYLIASAADIEAYKKMAKAKFTGRLIDLDLVDADATSALSLVGAAGGISVGQPQGATRRAQLRVKRVPADEAALLVQWQTGATLGDKPARTVHVTGCAAPGAPSAKLKLVGIANVGVKAWALLADEKGTDWALANDCVGSDHATIKEVGRGYVTFKHGEVQTSLSLHPAGD